MANDKSYYRTAWKLAGKAGKGLSYVAGALWTGAAYLTGGQGENQDQAGSEVAPRITPSSGLGEKLSYEEAELQKALDFFINDEVFMEKYLN